MSQKAGFDKIVHTSKSEFLNKTYIAVPLKRDITERTVYIPLIEEKKRFLFIYNNSTISKYYYITTISNLSIPNAPLPYNKQ